MRAAQRDYLASNRVLAPTLRLKPFSITEISADVAPTSSDRLRSFQLLAPFMFAGSVPLYQVILEDPWSVECNQGTRERLPSRHADSHDGHRAPEESWHAPGPFCFRLERKSIQASPCLKSHSEADQQLRLRSWSLSLRPWLTSRRCEALTHSCPISRGLMPRLLLSK